MLYKAVYSLGTPGTFDITDKDNPLYYIARYCHEMSQNLFNLDDEDFLFFQMEQTDMTAAETIWGDFSADVMDWIPLAVAASEAGTSIPAVPTEPNLPATPLSGTVISLAIRAAVQIFLYWLRNRLDSDTDATEIAQVLKRALLSKDGEGDEYAIIQQLANTPMEIVVSKEDSFSDVSYADRPET
jgi:hypothetical protein